MALQAVKLAKFKDVLPSDLVCTGVTKNQKYLIFESEDFGSKVYASRRKFNQYLEDIDENGLNNDDYSIYYSERVGEWFVSRNETMSFD